MLFCLLEEPEMDLWRYWLEKNVGSCTEKTLAPSLET